MDKNNFRKRKTWRGIAFVVQRVINFSYIEAWADGKIRKMGFGNLDTS